MSIILHRISTLTVCLLLSPFSLAAIREYHLNIAEQEVNVTGKPVKKITVNGQFPAPTLYFEEGDEAVIHVHNQLKNQDTSLHWHGLLLPGLMDGVPGFNGFKGIAPNGDFVYRFKVKQNATVEDLLKKLPGMQVNKNGEITAQRELALLKFGL